MFYILEVLEMSFLTFLTKVIDQKRLQEIGNILLFFYSCILILDKLSSSNVPYPGSHRLASLLLT